MRLFLPLLLIALVFSACVNLPRGAVPSAGGGGETVRDVFPELDPGAHEHESLHFLVRAYSAEKAKEVSEAAEADYQRIMLHTGLYSFKPEGLYSIVVYSDREEYLRKTGLPEWSGGVIVGNAIYSFEGRNLRSTLAHEMAHLVFNEYMGGPVQSLTWINEGLAVYEEILSSSPEHRREMEIALEELRENAIPFVRMVNFVPVDEREGFVDGWYAQVGSVVGFMVETGAGGRMGFSELLACLREGYEINMALREAFPGRWESLPALEKAWRGETKK